jgi:hypothetical protein
MDKLRRTSPDEHELARHPRDHEQLNQPSITPSR